MKLCKDCAYFEDRSDVQMIVLMHSGVLHKARHACKHPELAVVSPVTGDRVVEDCEKMRANASDCGPDAIRFEPKATEGKT